MSPCPHSKQGTPIHPRSKETGLSGPLTVKVQLLPLHEMVVPRGARTMRGPFPSGSIAEEIFSLLGMLL